MKAKFDEADALLARFAEYQRAQRAELSVREAIAALKTAADNLRHVSLSGAPRIMHALYALAVAARRARRDVAKIVAEREIKRTRRTK